MARKLFLPGAGGSASFWQPVIAALPAAWDMHSFGWPGLGDEPHQAGIDGLDDLVSLVLARMDDASDLIAQSMGALVALKVALRAPEKVRRLVLAGTSGGLPGHLLDSASDWRPAYRKEFPSAQSWIMQAREDLSAALPTIRAPTLLLWGDRDQISPVRNGEALRALLPDATLRIVAGGDHDFPQTHGAETAALIGAHLS